MNSEEFVGRANLIQQLHTCRKENIRLRNSVIYKTASAETWKTKTLAAREEVETLKRAHKKEIGNWKLKLQQVTDELVKLKNAVIRVKKWMDEVSCE